jgi:hypothetical protein
VTKKADILNNLRSAKAAHLRWKAHAHAMVEGLPLEEGQIPMIHTDCAFGKWYYGAGQSLSSLSTYSALDEPHEQLHTTYMKIFKLLFGEDDRSMLGKLFGSKAKPAKNQAEAETLMAKLATISADVVNLLSRLEKEILAMSDEEVDALV